MVIGLRCRGAPAILIHFYCLDVYLYIVLLRVFFSKLNKYLELIPGSLS
jgi:hypothetical protein